MSLHLVWNWADSWKWISQQASAALVVVNTFALSFPPAWANYVHIASIVLGMAAMFGRIIQQTPPAPGMPDRTIQAKPGETVAVHVEQTKETP